MRSRRWPRYLACALVGAGVLIGAAVFAIAKRPLTGPQYPAEAWTGQSTAISGWLTAQTEGGTVCWVINAGYIDDPDSRTGLVLPDSYRSFGPALVDRGAGDPVEFISGPSLWAGPPVATAYTEVTANVRIAQGDAWRDAALAQWEQLCDGLATVNAVAVVEPGSLQPTG